MSNRQPTASSSVEALDAYIRQFRRERGIPSPPPAPPAPPQPSLSSFDTFSETVSVDTGAPSSDDSVWQLENQTTLRIRQELAKLADQLKRDLGRKSSSAIGSRSRTRRSITSLQIPRATRPRQSLHSLTVPSAYTASTSVQTDSLSALSPSVSVSLDSLSLPRTAGAPRLVSTSIQTQTLSSFSLSPPRQQTTAAAAAAEMRVVSPHKDTYGHRTGITSAVVADRRAVQERADRILLDDSDMLLRYQQSPHTSTASRAAAVAAHISATTDTTLSSALGIDDEGTHGRYDSGVVGDRSEPVRSQPQYAAQPTAYEHPSVAPSVSTRSVAPSPHVDPARVTNSVQTSPPAVAVQADPQPPQPQSLQPAPLQLPERPTSVKQASVSSSASSGFAALLSMSPPPLPPFRLSHSVQTSPPATHIHTAASVSAAVQTDELVQTPRPLESTTASSIAFVGLSPPRLPPFRLSHSVQTSPIPVAASTGSAQVTAPFTDSLASSIDSVRVSSSTMQSSAARAAAVTATQATLAAPLATAETASAAIALTDNSSAKLADIMRRLTLLQQETRLALNMMDTFRLVDPTSTDSLSLSSSAQTSLRPASSQGHLIGRSPVAHPSPLAQTVPKPLAGSVLTSSGWTSPIRRATSVPATGRYGVDWRLPSAAVAVASVSSLSREPQQHGEHPTASALVASKPTVSTATSPMPVHRTPSPQQQQQRQQPTPTTLPVTQLSVSAMQEQRHAQQFELVSPPVLPVYSERSTADVSAVTVDSTIDSVVDITGVSYEDNERSAEQSQPRVDGSPASVIHVPLSSTDRQTDTPSIVVTEQTHERLPTPQPSQENASASQLEVSQMQSPAATSALASSPPQQAQLTQQVSDTDMKSELIASTEQPPATPASGLDSSYEDSVLLASPTATPHRPSRTRSDQEADDEPAQARPAQQPFGLATITTQDFALSAASSMLSMDHTTVSLSPLIRQGEQLLSAEWTTSAEAAAAALERTLLDIDAVSGTPSPSSLPQPYLRRRYSQPSPSHTRTTNAATVTARPPRYPSADAALSTPTTAAVLDVLLSPTPVIELPTPYRDGGAVEKADDIVTWFLERTPPPQ